MFKIKPFTTEHTFEKPQQAIDFYENCVGVEFPEEIVQFLYEVTEMYPDALFNVQPGIPTNYIAIARKDDRKPWAFVKPHRMAIWVAHSRNSDALRELFHGELVMPENPTKVMLEFVDVYPEHAAGEGAEAALCFAANFARPYTEDGPPPVKFS